MRQLKQNKTFLIIIRGLLSYRLNRLMLFAARKLAAPPGELAQPVELRERAVIRQRGMENMAVVHATEYTGRNRSCQQARRYCPCMKIRAILLP